MTMEKMEIIIKHPDAHGVSGLASPTLQPDNSQNGVVQWQKKNPLQI